MKTNENQEIGELVGEITSKGWELKIDVYDDHSANVRVWKPSKSGDLHEGATNDSLIGAIRNLVDILRHLDGEPTLAQELENMLAADEQHAATIIQCGPDARCTCGKVIPLIIERKIRFECPWDGRPLRVKHSDLLLYRNFYPQPGEIGTCPDCGKHYTFPGA